QILPTPSPCRRGGLGSGGTCRFKNHFDHAGQRLGSLQSPLLATRPRHLSLTLSLDSPWTRTLDKEREQKFILAFRLNSERQFHLRGTIEQHSAVLVGHAQLHRDQRRAESGFGLLGDNFAIGVGDVTLERRPAELRP